MHLIDVDTYEIREFFGDSIPEHAILSHTWGNEEVTFQDMQELGEDAERCEKLGFQKIRYTCQQAKKNGISWAWVDTCCINKTSSSELSEAINSMYAWYQNSKICYAYLIDVLDIHDVWVPDSELSRSRWFSRGWTLQELIAPRIIFFFNKNWEVIGSKGKGKAYPLSGRYFEPKRLGPWLAAAAPRVAEAFPRFVAQVANIPEDIMIGRKTPTDFSVAQRFSWASKRQCTRTEDVAYSLMGLFNVNIPYCTEKDPTLFLGYNKRY